jgi:hypothetical protein
MRGGIAMLKLSGVFLAVGVGSEAFFLLGPSERLGPCPLIAFTSFSLFLILFALGLPATRKLLD